MTVIEILRRTRELLSDPRRWAKHTYRGFNTVYGVETYCLVGAMDQVSFNVARPRQRAEMGAALLKTIEEQYGKPGVVISLTSFNDRMTTSHDDVLLVLDKTISSLEA